MTINKIASAAAIVALLCGSAAAEDFNYSRYQAADLDEIVAQARPRSGADILPQTKLKLDATLIGYGEPCDTGFLKRAMLTAGVPQQAVDAVAITTCIRLRTAKGKEVRMFVQDPVAGFLPKEVPLGSPLSLFALWVFNDADGPGLLVSEFSTRGEAPVQGQPAPKPGPAVSQAAKPPAAGADATTTELRGEWQRTGPSFVCRTDPRRNPPPKVFNPDTFANACLHMGPFGIGNAASTITSALGPPQRTQAQPNDGVAWLYFLEQQDKLPYFVATVRKNRITALQVSGVATSKDYTFNHIGLGDDTATLLKYFGKAYQIKPSGEKDTDLWTYSPWPFSFEIKGGRVTSVRIIDAAYEK